jgi:hypothetical protein
MLSGLGIFGLRKPFPREQIERPMALFHIPLDQIDETRLQALIDGRASEGRLIDYKRTTYGSGNADHSEFLADVSSFANTAGGDIVLGVAATDGIPTEFVPLELSMDAEVLRLEQMARSGLQPRIANIAFKPVPIERGGQVLIIRIPRSYNPPHRVVRQGSNRFWARSSAGKYEPDVDELRALFTAVPLLADRVRDFRLDRLAKISTGQAPVQLMERGSLVIHVVPLSAFSMPIALPLEEISRDFGSFSPMGSRTPQGIRINFDGLLKLSNADQTATRQRAYVQLFQKGVVEAVTSTIISTSTDQSIIFNLDEEIIFACFRYLNDLSEVGVEPPYVLFVSLVGVKGARFNLARRGDPSWFDRMGDTLDRDEYHLTEVIIETIPNTPEKFAKLMRPILDQLANAAGVASSPSFDRQGNYIPIRGKAVVPAARYWSNKGCSLGHRNIQHTVRYTELSPTRFKDFWRT